MENHCQKLKENYIETIKLQREFDMELTKVAQTKEVIDVKVIKTQIEATIEIMRLTMEIMPCSPERAEKILGKDYLGPETIQSVFKYKLKEIPEIPFTIKDIEKAKELGQYLILRITKFKPLLSWEERDLTTSILLRSVRDVHKVNDLIAQQGRYLYDTPRLGWALVNKESVGFGPAYTTEKQSYDVQTTTMLDYLSSKIYRNRELPEKYNKMLHEYNVLMKDAFTKGTPTQPDFESVQKLGINQVLRHTFVEVLYDIYVYYQKNKEFLFTKDGVATSSVANVGATNYFITVAYKDNTYELRQNDILNPKPEIGAVISRRF